MNKYTAKSLNDIADAIDQLARANDIAKSGDVYAATRSATLREVAQLLRNTTLVLPVISADDLKAAFGEGFATDSAAWEVDSAWDASDIKKVAEAKDLSLFVIQGNDYPNAIVRGTQEQVDAYVAQLDEQAKVAASHNGHSVHTCIYWRAYPFAIKVLG